MNQLFETLYAAHPLLPLAYLALLGNGLLGPAIYSALRGIPYDIGQIWTLAKRGQIGARYVVASWAALVAVTVLMLAIGVTK
jgi:hypothetical protein